MILYKYEGLHLVSEKSTEQENCSVIEIYLPGKILTVLSLHKRTYYEDLP